MKSARRWLAVSPPRCSRFSLGSPRFRRPATATASARRCTISAAAFAWLVAGTAISAAAVVRNAGFFSLLPFGVVATTAGMGLLQAVIYHHCAHGTVLATRRANRALGKFITLLLIKDFDAYQREHIGHHNPNKLLESGDEFVDYLSRFIGIIPGMSRRQSWCRVLVSFFSQFSMPGFLRHACRDASVLAAPLIARPGSASG